MNFAKKSYSNKFVFMERRFFIHSRMQNLAALVLRLRETVTHILEGTQVDEMFNTFVEVTEDSCFLKFILFSIVMNCILPIFAFAVFAVLSLITTFTGFLLVEGSLLILGACVTILWLGAVGILSTLTAGITVLVYLIYRHAGDIAYKTEKFNFLTNMGSVDDDVVVVDTDRED